MRPFVSLVVLDGSCRYKYDDFSAHSVITDSISFFIFAIQAVHRNNDNDNDNNTHSQRIHFFVTFCF